MQEVQYFKNGGLEEDRAYSKSAEMQQCFREHVREVREKSGNQVTRVRRVKLGRNDPCPCGSGKKFKKCCL